MSDEYIVTIAAFDDDNDDATAQQFAATAGTVEAIRALLGEPLLEFILPNSQTSAVLDVAATEGFVMLEDPDSPEDTA
jgi:hypothetical protein